MPVTLREVALRAGVSRSAVSRTFTEGASVSPRTRAKVERAAEELGYRPNVLASSLTTGRTKLIGLVANNFRNPLFLEVFDLFTAGLQGRGLRPLLVNLSGEASPADSVRLLRQYSVDGVILASSTLPPAFARAFTEIGVPVVHSFGRFAPQNPVHVVGIDNAACGRMAADALYGRGYRHIGFLGGPKEATSTIDRLEGFRAVLSPLEDVTLTTRFAEDYTFDAGLAAMERCLEEGAAEAYFCGDDVLSLGAMSAIRSAGLEVPGDIGLIGLNDMDMARWPGNDLTTIRQPVRRIIETSIDLVVSMAETPREPEAHLFDCELIERGTLRAFAQGGR